MEEPLDGEKAVTVRLEDLCRIAAWVAGIMHDVDNREAKHVRIDMDNIHEVGIRHLGAGGGCHEHRCRLCPDFRGYRQV